RITYPSTITGPPPPLAYPLSLHDALPIFEVVHVRPGEHGEAYSVDVFLEGRCHDHRRGLAQARVDDLHAGVFQGTGDDLRPSVRSEEHTSELQSREKLVCRLLLEKKNKEC